MIGRDNNQVSIRRQCELVGLPRSSYYYEATPETSENLELMRAIDKQYLKTPFFGSRQMTSWFRRQGENVNRKRVQRLMRLMRLEAIYPRKNTSKPGVGHKVYPYLLRDVNVTRANQVWCTDITYIGLRYGFMYLVAIMDWYSRHVLSWKLSNSLDTAFCIDALEDALVENQPEIFNSDQGSQFTSEMFTTRLLNRGIAISMDGRGRALDNVFIERLWRSVKYEEIYLKEYNNVDELYSGLSDYFAFYTMQRPHQGLNNRTPFEVYTSSLATAN